MEDWRALFSARGKRKRPGEFTVRPANDDFERAQVLAGGFLTITGITTAATTEAGEATHPAGADGNTVWYRWTAPADGIVRIHVPEGSGTAITVFRGRSLTNLTVVASNPAEFWQWFLDPNPLLDTLFFSARAGKTYHVQIASHHVGPWPLIPFTPCSPGWSPSGSFTLRLRLLPGQVGPLKMVLARGQAPFGSDQTILIFGVKTGARYAVVSSVDLLVWRVELWATSTGGTEVVALPRSDQEPSRFYRVLLLE